MPQHAKRLKVRRKDLRKPDEFETLTGQAVDWAQAHRPLVGGVVVAALVAAVIALGVGRWRSSRDEAAAAAFNLAQATFTDGKFADAARAFEDVLTTYPRAPFGRLAGLYRAHALARSGDASGGATAYGEYLVTSPDSDYLRQEALDGLGRAKEASGDSAGALEAYTQAGALTGPYRTDALLGAARVHDASGEADKAREIYASLLKDVSDPDTKALLTAKLPGKVAAPPPAERDAEDAH